MHRRDDESLDHSRPGRHPRAGPLDRAPPRLEGAVHLRRDWVHLFKRLFSGTNRAPGQKPNTVEKRISLRLREKEGMRAGLQSL